MLAHLPDELLLHIFSYLIPYEVRSDPYIHPIITQSENQEALSKLCRTCRHFRFLAEPMLYSGYIKPENLRRNNDNYQPNSSFRNYLRTIIERPDLADGVRTVTLFGWETEDTLKNNWESSDDGNSDDEDGDGGDRKLLTRPPSVPLAHSFYETASKLLPPGPVRTEWLIALCRGEEDAEVALLLALLPNVEILQIVLPAFSAPDDYHFLFFHRTIRQGRIKKEPSNMHSFLRLKRLDIQNGSAPYYDSEIPMYPLADLMQSPRLEIFNGLRIYAEGDPNQWGEWRCPKGASPVRDISISECILSSEAIAMLMDSCLGLRSLEIAFSHEYVDEVEFEWSEVGKALRRHESSLQRLSIDLQMDAHLKRLGSQAPMLGSLKNFTSLRHLEIQQSALIGLGRADFDLVEILPSSLEYLRILNTDTAMESHLLTLATQLTYLPRLQKIRVESCIGDNLRLVELGYDAIQKERTDAVRTAFGAAGIEWEGEVNCLDQKTLSDYYATYDVRDL